MKTTIYRKGTLEAKLDEMLPEYPSYAVIAYELQRDDGSWCVNTPWYLARSCDRDEAISHLRHRWEVFKVNYHSRARVADLVDSSWDSESPALLEVDCIPFAEVRDASR